MPPSVLYDMGDILWAAAMKTGCGARITGAGGYIWAIGETDAVKRLRPIRRKLLSEREEARLLDCRIDPQGVDSG